PTYQAGAVDQRVEHRVDGGQHPGGRLVPALVGQQVGHLLVEVDAGLRLPGGVDLLGHGRLDVRPAAGRLGDHAELADHRLVAQVGALGGGALAGERVGDDVVQSS